MAVDPKWDEIKAVVAADSDERKPSSRLAARASHPSVESSLDAFISRAHDNQVDISELAPDSREQSLVKEIDALKSRLADANGRLADANGRLADANAKLAEAQFRPSGGKRWPWALGAFVVGAASMFAVSFVVPIGTPETTTAKAARLPPQPEPAPPPQPVQVAAPVQTAQPVEPDKAQPPAATVEAAVEKSNPTPKPAANQHPSHKPTATKANPVGAHQTAPGSKPAEDHPAETPPKSDESGSGLYNPF